MAPISFNALSVSLCLLFFFFFSFFAHIRTQKENVMYNGCPITGPADTE